MKRIFNILISILLFSTIAPGPSHGQSGPKIPALARIMIDPGHGGLDRGVVGPSGWPECQLTVTLAQTLKTALEAQLGVKVFLTREEGQNLSLLERTTKANALKTDLLVSLHARGSLSSASKGFVVYYQDYGHQAELGEAMKNMDNPGDVELEWSLNQAACFSRAKALAREVDRALQDVLHIKSGGPVGLPLALLAGARQPAILVEVGALTNPEEERRLKTQGYKEALTRALVLGIESWARNPD